MLDNAPGWGVIAKMRRRAPDRKGLAMPQSIDGYFADWEAYVFGYGYGSGEEHTIPALKTFLAAIGEKHGTNCYDFEVLEKAVTPTVAWLMLNTLCHANLIEYGTSPRYGWLTPTGIRLQAYVASKTAEELIHIACARTEDDCFCTPESCNCSSEQGYVEGAVCQNPFWLESAPIPDLGTQTAEELKEKGLA